MESGIDPAKLAGYLATLNPRAQQIVQKIVGVTRRITTPELVSALKRTILRFETREPKYNLYIPEGKIGSEHWLLTLLEESLHPVETFYGQDEIKKLANSHPIILIDDAIYSSVRMCSIIDEQIRYETGIKNKVYCLVAVASSLMCQVSTDAYFNAEIISDLVLDDLTPGKLLGSDHDSDLMEKTFGCQTDCVLPIYFDHKVANEFGSYQFYHRIIKDPVSRAPIDALMAGDIRALAGRFKAKQK